MKQKNVFCFQFGGNKHRMDFDLIIIGDGLFGKLMAHFAAKNKIKVCLIGKRNFKKISSSYRSEAFVQFIGSFNSNYIHESINFYQNLLQNKLEAFSVYSYINEKKEEDKNSDQSLFSNHSSLSKINAGEGYKLDSHDVLRKLNHEIIKQKLIYIKDFENLTIAESKIENIVTVSISNKHRLKTKKIIFAIGPWFSSLFKSFLTKKITIFELNSKDLYCEPGLHVCPKLDSFVYINQFKRSLLCVDIKSYIEAKKIHLDCAKLSAEENTLAFQLINKNFNFSNKVFKSIKLKSIGFDSYNPHYKNFPIDQLISLNKGTNIFSVPPMNGSGFKYAPSLAKKYIFSILENQYANFNTLSKEIWNETEINPEEGITINI